MTQANTSKQALGEVRGAERTTSTYNNAVHANLEGWAGQLAQSLIAKAPHMTWQGHRWHLQSAL